MQKVMHFFTKFRAVWAKMGKFQLGATFPKSVPGTYINACKPSNFVNLRVVI